jgi:hypothetical protein
MNLKAPQIDTTTTGSRHLDVRWRLGRGDKHERGAVLLGWAGWLLAVLGAGVLIVSFSGQYMYLINARHQHIAALIESAMLDVGMIIFTLLALALSRMGKQSRPERVLIVVCALGSAGMGYAAADTASLRSIVAFVAPPIFLAIVVDRLVAVIRRHVLGDEEERSAWTSVGWFVSDALRASGKVALYSLRFALDPGATASGVRRMVLNAAPLPGLPAAPTVRVLSAPADDDDEIVPPTKKDRLLRLYRGHESYGKRAIASQVAAELAPFADLQAGTARTYIYEEIDRNRETYGSAS